MTQRCPGQRSFDLELYLWQRSVWLSFVLNSDPFCLSTVWDTAEKRERKLSLRIHKSQISLRILNKEVRWECILQKAGARKSRETVIYCKSSAREKWLKRVTVKTFYSERNFLFKVFIDFKYIMLCFNIFNMFKQQEFCIAIIQ